MVPDKNDNRIMTTEDVIDSSRIVVERGCLAKRIVLRDLGHEYVVHTENLRTVAGDDDAKCRFQHESFESGGYFRYQFPWYGNVWALTKEEALQRATEAFEAQMRML